MSIPRLGGHVGEYRSSSLARVSGAGSGWSTLSRRPLFSGWVSSLCYMMVPNGYAKLQEERQAMVDLGAKAEAGPVHNGYRQEVPHVEGRRLLERASRSAATPPDSGDGAYSETEPMLTERRLSCEESEGRASEKEEEDDDDHEGPKSDMHNMPKESPLGMALQILVPFLLAGFGTVSAGMVLDIVQVSSACLP